MEVVGTVCQYCCARGGDCKGRYILEDVEHLLDGPNSAKLSASHKLRRNAVVDCYSQLLELEAKVGPKKPRKMASFLKFRTASKWPFESKEFEKQLQNMERCRNTILVFLALQVYQTIAVLGIAESQDNATLFTVLSRLPSAEGASFDSQVNESDPKYHPGTRTNILQQIFTWPEDKQSQTIFSINWIPDKILFSSDNKLLAAETNEAVVLWDAETGEPTQKFKHPSSILPYNFAFAWNADLLAVVYPSSIHFVNPSMGVVLQELFTQKREWFITLLFSPDDKVLPSVSYHAVQLWTQAQDYFSRLSNQKTILCITIFVFPGMAIT
ncbi:hypothetical protein ACJ72_06058 [Emergomyces africanus]|uniref:Uncharacterized protein n=1 Tax=Emergomyces africanus TaxID=1955775 RepID=A0A1B7NSG6_9EURO|nr:hypothetical protein ACJ72_06058 [Emergomyces africanus]